MKRLLFVLFALPACVPTAETPGQVAAFNGSSVTIRGAGDYSPGNIGKGFKPTPAMQAQAEAVCPGATFVSGIPEQGDSWAINYLFTCPK